jgi:hypothetical protein
MWNAIGTLFGAVRTEDAPEFSRRRFLLGMGIVGGIAAVAPSLLGMTPANAAEPEPLVDAADKNYELAQRRDDRRDRRDDRRDRNRRQSRRRYNRRDFVRSCERDPRFRRDNRDLCRQVTGGRGRRGRCVDIGPVTICD